MFFTFCFNDNAPRIDVYAFSFFNGITLSDIFSTFLWYDNWKDHIPCNDVYVFYFSLYTCICEFNLFLKPCAFDYLLNSFWFLLIPFEIVRSLH